MKKVFSLICVMVGWVSLLSAQEKKMTPEEYIEAYREMAIKEMKRSGVPASITLSQGLLESGSGNSYLAREGKNHFGIKCKSNWTGRSVKLTDDAPDECFRAYNSVEESYKDHSDFLLANQRYAFLFELDPKDYKGWAEGLKKAGYATNPRYPQLLISLIERYELNQYDDGIIRQKPQLAKKDKKKNRRSRSSGSAYVYNNIPAYVVQEGDDYASIADGHEMMRWQIRKYNDLDRRDKLEPGTIIYLKPKKRKAKNDYHTVQEGESMYYIAQLEGIKLRRLYKLNRMEEGQEAVVGEKLHLRKKRKEAPKISDYPAPAKKQGIRVAKPAPPKPDTDSTARPGTDGKPVQQAPVAGKAANNEAAFGLHTVKKGETAYGIAKQYSMTVDELLNLNDIVAQIALYEGQMLKVKKSAAAPAAAKKDTAVKKTAPATQVASGNTAAKGADNTSAAQFHTVQPGETLYSIYRSTGVPVDSIKKYNQLPDNSLSVGQQLRLGPEQKAPAIAENKTATAENATSAAVPLFHTVQAGETLYAVARKYSLSVSQIKEWNRLESDAIAAGQKLRLKP